MNGQWLKSIEIKLSIIEKEFTLSLGNDTQNETVVLRLTSSFLRLTFNQMTGF